MNARDDVAASPWLALRARATPAALALEIQSTSSYGPADERISWAELLARSGALAAELGRAGVRRGDVVAALFENGAELPVLLFALHGLGAVLLPLSTRLTAGELAHPLADSGAVLLLHGDGASDRALRAGRAREAMDAMAVMESSEARSGRRPRAALATAPLTAAGGLAARPPDAPPLRALHGGAPADPLLEGALALLYTSGTTGPAKGAVLDAEAFRASAEGSAALLGAGPGDRWLVCMPLFHVGGLSIVIRCCLTGSAARIHRRFDPEAVSRDLEACGITHVSLVANMLERVLDARGARPAPPSLRVVLLGGGPAPEPLLERGLALGWPIAPTYGLTEAASQVATRPPGERAQPLGGGLRPLPGTSLRILGELGRDAAPGEPGEILVRGGTLMRGYLGRPDATARALRDGWLHTGDIGVLDGAGRLAVLDRRDDLIVSGGENVYPAEIEAVLRRHPAVADAGVVGEPDARFGARPVAYWVPVDPSAAEPDLAAHCRAALAAFKVPVAFRRRAALPRSASDKLSRRALRDEPTGPAG